jgi:phage/plasmid-associated DNA primase
MSTKSLVRKTFVVNPCGCFEDDCRACGARLEEEAEAAEEARAVAQDEELHLAGLEQLEELYAAAANNDNANTKRRPARKGHAQLAQDLLDDVQGTSSAEPVFSEGKLWRYEQASGLWEEVSEAEQSRILQSYAVSQKINAGDVSGAIRLASHLADRPNFFAEAPAGLLFANGFARVDASGIHLERHSPDHRVRSGYRFELKLRAVPRRAIRFLRDVWEGDKDRSQKIHAFQEFGGMSLIGKGPVFQSAMVFTGRSTPKPGETNGSNGKSQAQALLLGAHLKHLVCHVRPQEMGAEYNRAVFAGKRLNCVGELPESDVLDSAAFKAIIAGEPIQGRVIYHAPFSFTPEASHLFACNGLPGTVDTSYAFFRRWTIVTFNRTFRPGDPGFVQDIGPKIVEAERAELIAWFLEGAVRALRKGAYTVVPSALVELEEWRANANPVELFINEKTIAAESDAASTDVTRVYAAYVEWCETTRHKVLSSNNFGRRLAALGRPSIKGTHGKRFYPLRLRDRMTREQIEAAEAKNDRKRRLN